MRCLADGEARASLVFFSRNSSWCRSNRGACSPCANSTSMASTCIEKDQRSWRPAASEWRCGFPDATMRSPSQLRCRVLSLPLARLLASALADRAPRGGHRPAVFHGAADPGGQSWLAGTARIILVSTRRFMLTGPGIPLRNAVLPTRWLSCAPRCPRRARSETLLPALPRKPNLGFLRRGPAALVAPCRRQLRRNGACLGPGG